MADQNSYKKRIYTKGSANWFLFCRFLIRSASLPRASIGTKNVSTVSNVVPHLVQFIMPMKVLILKFIASPASKSLFLIMKYPNYSMIPPSLNLLNPRVAAQDVMELFFKLRKLILKEEFIIKSVFLVNNARDPPIFP